MQIINAKEAKHEADTKNRTIDKAKEKVMKFIKGCAESGYYGGRYILADIYSYNDMEEIEKWLKSLGYKARIIPCSRNVLDIHWE